MSNSKMTKWLLFVIALIVASACIAFFSKYRIAIPTNSGDSIDPAVAETLPQGQSLSKEAEDHFKKGHEFLKEKDWDGALKEFDLAAKSSPNSPIPQYWIGMTYFYKHETERAIAKFKKVLELEPKNYHALAMIGKILSFNKEKLDDAADYLKKALQINPDYADAKFDLGRVYALKGDTNLALGEFASIFMSEPRYAFYHYEVGRIFESMKAFDRAKQEYSRALQLDPGMSNAKEALERLKQK
jgi:tetratricopeptide (TPR) repeat protein